jgi:hypothetical protein
MILRLIHSDKLRHFTDKTQIQYRWLYVRICTSEFLAALLNTIGDVAKIRCH